MLQYISVHFQAFPLATGWCMRHDCDMDAESFDVKWTWGPPIPVMRPSGRLPGLYRFQTGRRRPGKPPASARLRRDQIAAFVSHLEQTEPDMRKVLVAKAAAEFGVNGKTVRNALRDDRKLDPIDLGFINMRYGQTVDLRPK
jgi:hypothetical protein